MDNVIISCTVGDEEALVDNGCSCSGRRRRLVRYQVLVTTKQSKQTDTALGMYSMCTFFYMYGRDQGCTTV